MLERKPRKSKPKVVDLRSSHPAIQAIRSILKRYPRKDQWDAIIEAVGEKVNFEVLNQSFIDWCKRDYNPTDIRWVDWYRTRINKKHERDATDRERSFAQFRDFFT